MRSKWSLFVGLVAMVTVAMALPAVAQTSMDPGGYSSQQSIDESLTPSGSTVTVSRSDFGFLWHAMLWSQLAWVPASPMHSPSMLAVVNSGDRRWGLR